MKPFTLTLATRQSPLALWQAEYVKHQLESHHRDLKVTLLGLTTTADRTEGPLHQTGGKGLFVKELEEALLKGDADIAVHSMKDMPVTLPEGLILPAMCPRENPFDALVATEALNLAELPAGSQIGTGSPRRACQLLASHPHLVAAPLRGNVNTRLSKLHRGEYSAIILAVAGLTRLGLTASIQHIFSADEMLPAVGQGALGIECLTSNTLVRQLIAPLNHPPTLTAVMAERAVCRTLGAGCHTPVAVFAEIQNTTLTLSARVGSPDGQILLRTQVTGALSEGNQLGELAAHNLLEQGAAALLEVNT